MHNLYQYIYIYSQSTIVRRVEMGIKYDAAFCVKSLALIQQHACIHVFKRCREYWVRANTSVYIG